MIRTFICVFAAILLSVSVVQAQDASVDVHKNAGKDALSLEDFNRAEKEFSSAVDLAEHGSFSLATCLNDLATAYCRNGKFREAEDCMIRARSIIEKTPGTDSRDYAVLLDNFTRIYLDSRQYDKAEQTAKTAVEIGKKVIGADNISFATFYLSLTESYLGQKKYREAEESCKAGMKIAEDLLGPDHSGLAKMCAKMGACCYFQSRYAEAQKYYEKALMMAGKTFDRDSVVIAEILNERARVYAAQGNNIEAERLFKRALYTREQLVRINSPEVADSLGDYASFLRRVKRIKDAERLEARAKQIRCQKHAVTETEVAWKRSMKLSNKAMQSGDIKGAEAHLRDVLRISEGFPPLDSWRINSLTSLAYVLYKQGRNDEAGQFWQRSLDLLEPVFGSDHPPCEETILSGLGMYVAKRGDYEKSERLMLRAQEISEELFGPESIDVSRVLGNLAAVYRVHGRTNESIAAYQKSLDVGQKAGRSDDPDYVSKAKEYVDLLRELGKTSEAEEVKRKYKITD
jgi:tetratricopeptide (TPR) repeat protein